MPKYKYKFVKDGKEQESVGDFKDKASLYTETRNEGGSVLDAKEIDIKKRVLISFH